MSLPTGPIPYTWHVWLPNMDEQTGASVMGTTSTKDEAILKAQEAIGLLGGKVTYAAVMAPGNRIVWSYGTAGPDVPPEWRKKYVAAGWLFLGGLAVVGVGACVLLWKKG